MSNRFGVSQLQAEFIAKQFFPDEGPVENCLSEIGREGQLCTMCERRNERWNERVEQVRGVLLEAFKNS